MKNRKTDRRTLYTIMVIKDAFLQAVQTEPFSKVTITKICQLAEITRSTFYIHYSSLNDLLNDVLDDAFINADDAVLPQLGSSTENILSTCQRIGSDPKYRRLLMEPDLSEYIINRILQREKSKTIPSIMKETGVSQRDAEMLFSYTLHGSFAISKSHHFEKDAKWLHDTQLLNKFVTGGYRHLQKNK